MSCFCFCFYCYYYFCCIIGVVGCHADHSPLEERQYAFFYSAGEWRSSDLAPIRSLWFRDASVPDPYLAWTVCQAIGLEKHGGCR